MSLSKEFISDFDYKFYKDQIKLTMQLLPNNNPLRVDNIKTKKNESNKCVPCNVYRNLYPEPFEYVLRRHNISVHTFFTFRSKYKLVDRIFNEEIKGREFFLIEFELERIVEEIVEFLKTDLQYQKKLRNTFSISLNDVVFNDL